MRRMVSTLFALFLMGCAARPDSLYYQAALDLDGVVLDGHVSAEAMKTLDPYSLYLLGNYYLRGERVPCNVDLADRLFDAGKQHSVSEARWIAYGFKRKAHNLEKAIKWHEKAAAAGDVFSMVDLGNIYADEKSVFFKPEKALDYYARAIAAGRIGAHGSIGLMYYYGTGIERDYVRARKHFLLAGKDWPSPEFLGDIYLNGQGVAPDPLEAEKWFVKGARNGDFLSIRQLGDLYLGKTFGKDGHAVKALAWYLIGAVLKHKSLKARAEDLFYHMNDHDIRRAMTMAEKIIQSSKPKIYQYAFFDFYMHTLFGDIWAGFKKRESVRQASPAGKPCP